MPVPVDNRSLLQKAKDFLTDLYIRVAVSNHQASEENSKHRHTPVDVATYLPIFGVEGAVVETGGAALEVEETTAAAARSGQETGQAGEDWENAVRAASGGQRQIFTVQEKGLTKEVEIDSVTDEALIEAKNIENVSTAKNFLSRRTRLQIKRTIGIAASQNKSAIFWFKDEPLEGIRKYIEEHGGSVKVGL